MLDPRPTVESESRQLEAVIDAVGGRAAIFASSCCCLAASQLAMRDPLKVERIVFFGAYASRNDIPEAMRVSLVQFTRINWGLAAQMFASLFDPHAGGDELAEVHAHAAQGGDRRGRVDLPRARPERRPP